MVDNAQHSESVVSKAINGIYWFRRCLRVHDNPSLVKCIEGASSVKCVYFLDSWFAESHTRGNNGIRKWEFLLKSLKDLDKSLRKINLRLYVIRGQPAESFPRLFKTWNTNRLAFESDPEPFAQDRDSTITTLATEHKIDVIKEVSHTLYDPRRILLLNNGKVPTSFTEFQSLLAKMSAPDEPAPTVTSEMTTSLETDKDYRDEIHGVPTLSELGFEVNKISLSVCEGGESEGLHRMKNEIEKRVLLMTSNTKNLDTRMAEAGKMALGPYLRYGCLSSRFLYHYICRRVKLKDAGFHQPALLRHLIWREFVYALAFNNKEFDKEEKNPFCISTTWNKNQRYLKLFEKGRTGFPWIDAIMRQLRSEGWIHQAMRQILVSFFTCGKLKMSWEEGCKIFQDLLLDSDWATSAGYWAWASSKMRNAGSELKFCPVASGMKLDTTGSYIRKYLPVLRNMPIEYLHEPWKAPISVQKSAGCTIGEDYFYPMIHPYQTEESVIKIPTTANKIIKHVKTITQRINVAEVYRPILQQDSSSLPPVTRLPAIIRPPEVTRRKRRSTCQAETVTAGHEAKTLAMNDNFIPGQSVIRHNVMHDITNTPGDAFNLSLDQKANEKSIFHGPLPHYTSAGSFPPIMVTSAHVAEQKSYPMVVSLTEGFNSEPFIPYLGSTGSTDSIKDKALLYHPSVNAHHTLPTHATYFWTPGIRQQQ